MFRTSTVLPSFTSPGNENFPPEHGLPPRHPGKGMANAASHTKLQSAQPDALVKAIVPAQRAPLSDLSNAAAPEKAQVSPQPQAASHPSENSVLSPLMMAVRAGNLAAVDFLLQAGTGSIAVDATGLSPLTVAVMHGHAGIIRALVQHQAGAQAQNFDFKDALKTAVHAAKPAAVTALIEAGAPVDMELSGGGWTAMTLAARLGFIEVVRALVQCKADIHGRGDQISATMHAALHGHCDVVQLLVQEGANINNELLKVVAADWPEMVNALCLLGADANAVTGDGYSALMVAALGGCCKSVWALAAANVRIDAGDGQGRTALMLAASNDQVDAIQVLLHLRANRHAADNEGMTALMHAAGNGKVEAVKLLVAGDAVNGAGSGGMGALMLAAQAGQAEIVKVLMDSRACVGISNAGVGHAVELAANKGHVDVVRALAQTGADIDANLLTAVGSGAAASVATLLQAGANAHAADSAGATAPMLAQFHAHSEIAELLRAYGAVADVVPELPMSPEEAGHMDTWSHAYPHAEAMEIDNDMHAQLTGIPWNGLGVFLDHAVSASNA